jgi:hypothetical protein
MEFVEIERLLLVAVYDETYAPGRTAIRVLGCRGKRIPHGVQWGGIECSDIYKNLALMPRPGARHQRIDLLDTALLHTALRLHHRIDQALRYQPNIATRTLRLPRLWAGFRARDTNDLSGSGPEFEGLCEKFGMPAALMFAKFKREYHGLHLYPIEWTGHYLERATAVFAQMANLSQRQAFAATSAEDLVGYAGAAAYDFYSSRFRSAKSVNSVAVAPTLGRTA